MLHGQGEPTQGRWIAARLVGDDAPRRDARRHDSALEEGLSSPGVAPLADIHVDDLALLIDGSVGDLPSENWSTLNPGSTDLV
jgi:hypothetical protein